MYTGGTMLFIGSSLIRGSVAGLFLAVQVILMYIFAASIEGYFL